MRWRHSKAKRSGADHGATMLEYALVVTFIAVVVSTALTLFGPAVANLFAGVIPLL